MAPNICIWGKAFVNTDFSHYSVSSFMERECKKIIKITPIITICSVLYFFIIYLLIWSQQHPKVDRINVLVPFL